MGVLRSSIHCTWFTTAAMGISWYILYFHLFPSQGHPKFAAEVEQVWRQVWRCECWLDPAQVTVSSLPTKQCKICKPPACLFFLRTALWFHWRKWNLKLPTALHQLSRSLALPGETEHRRVGRRQSWTLKNMEGAWDIIQNQDHSQPNIPFRRQDQRTRERTIWQAHKSKHRG